MKKSFLLFLLCFAATGGWAQIQAIDPSSGGGFESGSSLSDNGWTVVNSATNAWTVGSTAGVYGGSNAAYISNDGSSYAYTLSASSTSHFYQDVSIPAGATSINVSFRWKGKGQNGVDRLLVYTAPTSVTPVADVPASSSNILTGATLRYTQATYNNSSYSPATIALPLALAGTTVRLIFTWQNNSSAGLSPGAALDDISFSYCTTPAIDGESSVCIGSSITLTNSESGGTWTSSLPAKATVNSTTGEVTGVAAGNTTITYYSPSGCARTTVITVKALPAAIGGTKSVCEGSTTTLTNAAGGTWSSDAVSVATIAPYGAGVVTGISAGTSNITYTSSTGCTATTIVTVNALPSSISGTLSICAGASETLTSSPSGGTWTSSTTARATVNSSTGVVTGVTPGTSRITYTLAGGCRTIEMVTINTLPAAIVGTTLLCNGTTVTLSNTTTGGTWSSDNASVATVGAGTGEVVATGTGNAMISYTSTLGCTRAKEITVNAAVPDITGTFFLCTGTTYPLANATSGGTWSSASTAIATVVSTTGLVNAISAGEVNITYTINAGCRAIATLTVNATPPTITGTAQICEGGFTTTLSNATSGGTWTSSTPAVGSIDASTGAVTGLVAGTTTIFYTVASGCARSVVFTVNPTPGAITGSTIVCIGSTTTLIPATLGGSTWSSSNTSVATVGVTSGVVSGVAIGTSTITYALTTGCYTTYVITANPTPAAIAGASSVCVGSVTTLTNTDAGGTWSSFNAGRATIDETSGEVTGVSAGTTTMSYTIAGCSATKLMSVNNVPAAITGTLITCVGGTTNLAISTAGGTWTSGSPAIATVGATGIVTGIADGVAVISYTNAAGCSSTTSVTVNPATPAITGTTELCAGLTTVLSIATTGGTWSSSNTAKATITSAGLLTAKVAGTANITYAVSSTCRSISTVTVNALPAAIGGVLNACVGQTATVTDATASGTWSTASSNITIGSATGIVTGVTAGTAKITYTLPTGCIQTATFTVKPLPAAIVGTTGLCIGSTVHLTDPTSGGLSWTSSTPAVATASASTGIITGVSGGTSTITYTLTSGCFTTTEVTVSPAVAGITGTLSTCAGNTETLANTDAGGAWSSSSTGVATVGAGTGLVTSVAAGTTRITYTLPSGCFTTAVFTVYPVPVTIGGELAVCVGSTSTLTNATTSGTWSSSNTAIATVGAGTGVVTGIGVGNVEISYVMATGCFRIANVTVNAAVPAITGATSVCTGTSTMLSNATSGGTWSSSSTATATVAASTGLVNGVAAGNVTITYSLGTGCKTTMDMTINQTPAAITGLSGVCAGDNITLSDATASGVWSSSNNAVGTISGAGVLSGLSAGSATITYTLGSCFAVKNVTVNPLPDAITGTIFMCATTTTVLSSATTTGASWTSSNPAVATIGITSGLVSALTGGTTNITYTTTAGCLTTTQVTVVASPSAIGGTPQVCVGATRTLTNTIPGGTWTSTTPSVATVGLNSGIVTGVATGITTITYSLGTSCIATVDVTVDPLPSSITGTLTVCETFTTTLSNATALGTWSSSTPAVATVVSGTGVVTGVSAGNSTITYTITATGCFSTANVTVNAQPAAITGTASVCAGLTTTLSNTLGGGAWSSSNAAVGTVNAATGVVTGISAGNTTITYTVGSCFATRVVTVNAIPNAITGTLTVCEGATTTLSSTTPTGTWTSSNTSVATVVSGTGVVSGVAAGNATITYTVTATGCITTATVTVNTLPAAITGSSVICEGSTTTLSDATGSGTWQSSNAAIATINSASGLVTGVSGGNVTMSYILSATGCFVTHAMTINALPAAIGGTASVCEGSVTTLTNATPSGTWSSSTPAVGTINSSTGVLGGISSGNTTITYTVTASGCFRTIEATVNPRPTAITGTASLCVNATTALSSTPAGGAWSSGTPANGTIDAGTGILTGISAGNTTITYTLSTGCTITRVATINALPNTITGTQSVCVGATTTLANTTPSGTWSSANAGTATVGSASGIVTGVASGNVNISYTVTATGCFRTAEVTVNPNPGAITGTATVCVGQTTTLGNSLAGGAWTSSNGNATVNITTGVVTGVTAGNATITYTVAGCFVTRAVTINALPNAIGGTASVCEGSSANLTEVTGSGTWTSSNTSIATIGGSGSPVSWTGVAVGNATITYTITATGCFVTREVTVNEIPTAFSPLPSVCVGVPTTITSTPAGGTWTSSNAGQASVGSATGILSGITAGTNPNLSYTLANGCRRITAITINANPNSLTGTQTVCEGSTTTFSSTTGGGTYTTADAGVATVVGATGVITGVLAGNTTITYTMPTGCLRTRTVTVTPVPTGISGTLNVCDGLTSTLTGAPSGGTWTSSNLTIATVGSNSGVVTAQGAGTTNITYTRNSCSISAEFTVTAAPAAITPTVNTSVCIGFTTTFANITPGGTWTSSNTAVATVGSGSGIVTGISGISGSGTQATISYTISTGCSATRNVTVYPNPGSHTSSTGSFNSCVYPTQDFITFTNASGSGLSWSSSNTAVGTIHSTAGIFRGLSAGTTIITFTQVSGVGGCFSTGVVTVNAAASAGTISGPTTVIIGNQIPLSSSVGSGGVWSSSTPAAGTVNASTGVVTGIGVGNTTITYTFNNGCGSATSTYTVSVTASRPGGGTVYGGADNPAYLANIAVYPNPNNGSFIIDGVWSATHDEDVVMEVRDMLGRLVYNTKITSTKGGIHEKITLENSLAKGMYILTLRSEDRNATIHFAIGE